MIYLYDVYYHQKLVIRNVRAISEQDAIDQVYMRDRNASASAYTGRERSNYRAVKK